MPITAVDSIPLALEHTREQLLKPFRIGQWTKLAFVGLLAGELGSSGFNRSNFSVPQHPGNAPHFPFPPSLSIDHALLAALIGALIIAALAIGIILLYVSSVMRFVLFDSILSRECRIRQGWSRRLAEGWRYFVWKLGYLFVTLACLVLLVGVPAALAFGAGWFKDPKQHIPVLALGGVFLAFVLLVFVVVTSIVLLLTKDFVVPQMALENIDATEGWRRLLSMMKVEKGAFATYLLTKIGLAIVARILIAIAAIIVGLIFAVPAVGLSILAVITGKNAGLTWNAHTITLAVIVGCLVLAAFLYLVSLLSTPAIVFFPAYSLYFFAARYPRLILPLYPASRPAPVPGAIPTRVP